MKALKCLKNHVIKHLCLYFWIYISILQTVNSRWIVAWLDIPGLVNKIAALMLYLPLACFVLWKLFFDLKEKRVTRFNLFYYGFSFYYFCLLVLRYLRNGEIKENLYYTIILLGSVALFDLVRTKRIKAEKEDVCKDILLFSQFMIFYRLVHVLWIKPHIYYSPINEIAICGCLCILFPIITKMLLDAERKTIWSWVCFGSLFGMVSILFTLSSRVGFWVIVAEIIVLSGYVFLKKKNAIRYAGAILSAVVLVSGLFVANVGEVRYAIYRETGIFVKEEASQNTPSQGNSDTDNSVQGAPSVNTPSTSTPPASTQQQAIAQTQRSDFMRGELFRLSLEEVKSNPLFGTGNCLFTYEASGVVYEAPVHNFVLATLNCYGIIGLIILAVLFFSMFLEMHLFDFKKNLEICFLSLFTLGIYFAIGLVQATVYDFQIMPTMFVLLAVFSLFLNGNKVKVQQGE